MLELILDKKVKKLRNKEIGVVKVQWRHHRGTDVTWEAEEEMRSKYPFLFQEIPRTESFEGVHELKLGIDTLRLRAKARQDHTRGSGVPHIDSTSGSGNADRGKHITEG
ncbi:hypothetical protein L1887_45948 [Cichorium endivia]|nr:hypothetical protein L1887_45948 [Cichorium endivia]